MLSFLGDFNLDRISFWLGFLAGTLLWVLIFILRPTLSRLIARIREQSSALRKELRTGVEIRLGNDILNYVQGLHLAAPLFSLDELVIEPRLLSPPSQTEPGVAPVMSDAVANLIPYTPDMPELAALYGIPTISLPEALQNTSRVVVMGKTGSGKSISLALLASRIIRNIELPGDLNQKTPIYIHAGDIVLPPRNPENLLETLVDAISVYASPLTLPRLLSHLETIFQSHRVLLLLDGLDEFPSDGVNDIVEFLGNLLSLYPDSQVVVASSMNYYDGLTSLDFAPMAISDWDENQRASFIRNWSELWLKYVGPNYSDAETIDPLLLNAWLLKDNTRLSPLELTLKVWAAYAEDTLGPKPIHAIEAYLRRMTVDVTNGRIALERLATGILSNRKPFFNQTDARSWLSGVDQSQFLNTNEPGEPDEEHMPDMEPAEETSSLSAVRILPALIDAGLLLKRQGDHLGLVHPQILGYLAGAGPLDLALSINLKEEFSWNSVSSTLEYFVNSKSSDELVKLLLQNSNMPRIGALFTTASWLRHSPGNATWRNDVLRKIVTILRDEDLPHGIRTRAGIALALSKVPNLETLYKQLFTSQSAELRFIASLTSGLMHDENLVDSLTEMVHDPSVKVGRAACLALVAIGSQSALENIAETLLHGSEELRRAAAEALANHPEEGYPTLREGATLEDILVRRAVIYGLQRINQLWAIEILEKMQIEDPQWAVQNVATNALEEMKHPNPGLPLSFPPLTETPWLISFAGERGIGVSPGKPARNLLILALKEGSLEQQLAALDYLLRHAQAEDILPIYELMVTTQGEVRESACNVLWHLEACGYSIPSDVGS